MVALLILILWYALSEYLELGGDRIPWGDGSPPTYLLIVQETAKVLTYLVPFEVRENDATSLPKGKKKKPREKKSK